MKFILSRVTDSQTHSKKWIIGHAFLFWVITRIIAVAMVVVCTMIYEKSGINQDMFPSFGGTPKAASSIGKLIYSLATVAIIAPVIEEIVFRLGLSFKKTQVALGLGFIPIFIAWSDIRSLTWLSGTLYGLCAIVILIIIYRYTSSSLWNNLKANHMVTAMWVTSVAFGLAHLRAFSYLSLEMMPYILCVIASPFFAGCACAYLRVNLGFKWGVFMHIFNNIPGIIAILLLSLG